MERSIRCLVVVATAATALAAPAGASAAARISLSVTPAVPAEATAFQIPTTGTADRPGGGKSLVSVYVGPGKTACHATPGFESTSSNGIRVLFASVANGTFRGIATVQGSEYVPFASGAGLEAGRYRACGYVTDQAGDRTVRARDREEFTVGGTCARARSKLARANRRLRRARRALRRARRQGTARRIRKAKRSVRKARKSVRSARVERKLFC